MLKAKTKLYPWQCYSCEVVFESNVEASVIWDEEGGERLHICIDCEDDTHIDDIVCDICGLETQVVYTLECVDFVCDCGHVQDLWQEEDEDEDEFDGENP